jgi:hypothetical protein
LDISKASFKKLLAFNHLGRLGHLGNQMFQYAAIKGIAAHNRIAYMIPKPSEHQLFDGFKMSGCTRFLGFLGGLEKRDNKGTPVDCRLEKEATFSFDSELFNHPPSSGSLYGFFQSEKYFVSIREQILEDFKFVDPIVESCKSKMASFADVPVSLHVRRKDYLRLQDYHHNLSLQWIERACALFPNLPILIFSDDIEWCKQQSLFQKPQFIFNETRDGKTKTRDGRCLSENQDHWYDLCLQSMCRHNIIANSSFSWWGAYLNKTPSRLVIAPDPTTKWFGPKNQHLDTRDIIPKNWQTLS